MIKSWRAAVLFALTLSLGLQSGILWAETESTVNGPAHGQSTGGLPESAQELLNHLYVNYFGIYHGPTVSDLGSPYTVDRTGNQSKSKYGAMNFDSELTTAYMVSSDIGIGASVPFFFVPVMGQGLILGDVGLKVFDRKTIATSDFSLYTNLILQAPTSDASQARNMSMGLKTTPYFRYHFSGSRFSVGSWSEAKAYLGVTRDKTFKLYGAPYVSYQLTSTLALNLEYEMEAHHDVGKPTFDFTSYQTDLQPGIVWRPTPRLVVNPYVQLFTGNKVTSETTAVGAVINATLL